MEEIHQLDRPTLAQRSKVDPFRLVIELELDREDFDVFWNGISMGDCSDQKRTDGRMAREQLLVS